MGYIDLRIMTKAKVSVWRGERETGFSFKKRIVQVVLPEDMVAHMDNK